MEVVTDFSWAPNSVQMVTAAMKLKDVLLLWETDITLLTKVPIVKAMVFSSSHIRMWELNHKESWVMKNWCFWTVVLEKTLESPLDSKEIKPISSKGNHSWILIRRSDAELKLKYFGYLMCWANSLEKTLILGKIEGKRKRGKGGWDGWMASPTQWTCVWANSGR